MKKNFRTKLTLFILLIIAFGVFSCKMFTDSFNQPVKQYFDNLTNNAQIYSYSLSNNYSYTTDNFGNICIPSTEIPSNENYTILFKLINPQLFSIEPTISFLGLDETVDTSNVTIQKGDDAYTLALNLPKEFLTSVDKTNKTLASTIQLKTTVSGVERTFESYNLNLHCDTVPPAINNAVVYTDTSTDPNKYVLCFNLPSSSLLKDIHKDIITLTINDTPYDITIADDGTASFTDPSLKVFSSDKVSINTETGEVSFTNNDNSTVNFEKNNVSFAVAGQPVYFKTTDSISDDNKTYKLTLTDKAGLSTTIKTSVQAIQLAALTLTDKDGKIISSGNSIEQDTGSSYATITFTPASTASNGNDTSDSLVIYEIYQGTDDQGIPLLSGKNNGGSVTLQVPSGQLFLRVYAHKDMYADSETYEYSIQVLKSKLFVSATGNDITGNGSQDNPYKTINNAINQLTDKTSSVNNINLLTDITENINIDSSTSIKLVGNNHTITGDITNSGNFIATNANITGKITNNGNSTLKDTIVIGKIEQNGTLLELDGSTTVSDEIILNNEKTITIGTLSANTVAKITPQDYTENTVILVGNTNHGTVTQSDCNKFTVTDDDSNNSWCVSNQGKLAKIAKVANETDLRNALTSSPLILLTSDITITGSTIEVSVETTIKSTDGETYNIKSELTTSHTFTVKDGGNLTLENVTFDSGAGALNINSGGTVTLNNGVNISTNGAYTPICVSGTCYMNSGAKITGNKGQGSNSATFNGAGGITVKKGGVFYMYGGEISDNNSSTNGGSNFFGGGIRLDSGASAYMYGGVISRNYSKYGGGVFVFGQSSGTCSFVMTGGTIEKNKATTGAGIYFVSYTNKDSLTINGGTIKSNYASDKAGAIYMEGGKLSMNGGTITNNACASADSSGGIHLSSYWGDGDTATSKFSSFIGGGSPTNASISGNFSTGTITDDFTTSGTPNDVYYSLSGITYTPNSVTIGTVVKPE